MFSPVGNAEETYIATIPLSSQYLLYFLHLHRSALTPFFLLDPHPLFETRPIYCLFTVTIFFSPDHNYPFSLYIDSSLRFAYILSPLFDTLSPALISCASTCLPGF